MARERQNPSLVVISYFDGRPQENLVALLDQAAAVPAGAPFDVLVVVNEAGGAPLALPERHRGLDVLTRANAGYNVGAWQHGWRARPGYGFYLFLQDECAVRRSGWLAAFLAAAAKPGAGFVGESLNHCPSWRAFAARWPDIAEECRRTAARDGLAFGPDPTHLQTLAVGARREVLEATGGFVEGDEKLSAVAGEVMTSIRARAFGYRNLQVAWRPFEYIEHPQWMDLREASKGWGWSLSRALHLSLPPAVDRFVPRRVWRAGA